MSSSTDSKPSLGTPIHSPLFLRTFAVAAREESDEETAMVVEAAADEIDRLRRVLQEIADTDWAFESGPGFSHVTGPCARLAKRALS
jgi:hypothetical protein